LRCCNHGYNNKNTFYDIVDSNKYLTLMTESYVSASSTSDMYDKVLFRVDKYELKRRMKYLELI